MSSPEVEWVLDTIGRNWTAYGIRGYGDIQYALGGYEELDYSAGGYGGEDVTVPLRRVDRDNSRIHDTGESLDMSKSIRRRTADLKTSCLVGATHADDGNDAVGTGYNHSTETVVGLRVEGLHHDKHGHIDPDGNNGIPFDHLVRGIKRAVLAERAYPDVPGATGTYHTLLLSDPSPQSGQYGDYYQYDFDVVLRGYEQLP